MTEFLSKSKDYYTTNATLPEHHELWSVAYCTLQQSQSRIDLSSPPELFFLPHAGLLPFYQPSKKRRVLDRFTKRIQETELPGSDYAIVYLQKKYHHNLAASTIEQSGAVTLAFLRFLKERNKGITTLSRHDIELYIGHEQDRGMKTGTIRTKLRALYTFVGYLVEEGILPADILLKKIRIKPPEILPKAIVQEDIEKLLTAITTIRDKALILLLLRTGMRIGELLTVKMTDLILPERKILIYLGEKNYQGRVVYFSDDADQALRKWLHIRKKEKRFLFYSRSGPKLGYVSAWTIMRKSLRAAGLNNKGYSLHCLRHTFATDMLNAGLRLEVLQQILGHRSIEITRRYARMSNITRETEYFKAMKIIEEGGYHESHRVNSALQTVFKEKKLGSSHG